MPSVEVALLIFIISVVVIGGGWFVYDANRDEEQFEFLLLLFSFLYCDKIEKSNQSQQMRFAIAKTSSEKEKNARICDSLQIPLIDAVSYEKVNYLLYY